MHNCKGMKPMDLKVNYLVSDGKFNHNPYQNLPFKQFPKEILTNGNPDLVKLKAAKLEARRRMYYLFLFRLRCKMVSNEGRQLMQTQMLLLWIMNMWIWLLRTTCSHLYRSMKVLSWNYRGACKSFALNYIHTLKRKFSLNIIILLETYVQQQKVCKVHRIIRLDYNVECVP